MHILEILCHMGMGTLYRFGSPHAPPHLLRIDNPWVEMGPQVLVGREVKEEGVERISLEMQKPKSKVRVSSCITKSTSTYIKKGKCSEDSLAKVTFPELASKCTCVYAVQIQWIAELAIWARCTEVHRSTKRSHYHKHENGDINST